MKPTEPGKGYRLIDTTREPFSADAEVLLPVSSWVKTTNNIAGKYCYDRGLDYRIKLPEAGEGYRLLESHELVEADDEGYINVGEGWQWRPLSSPRPLGQTVAERLRGQSFLVAAYRRKAEVQAGEGYRLLKVGEIIEEGDESCRVSNGREVWERRTARIGDVWNPPMYPTRRVVLLPGEVNPGYGYRLLGHGEKIQEGDEWLSGKVWLKREVTLGKFQGHDGSKLPTRRKVDVGEGYRLLEENEKVDGGQDECARDYSDDWEPVMGLHDYRAGAHWPTYRIRRKIKVEAPKPGHGYRLLAEGEAINEGDEWLGHFADKWEPDRCHYQGKTFYSETYRPYRRKLDIGEGYRLLAEDEPAQVGDQWNTIRGDGSGKLFGGHWDTVQGGLAGQSSKVLPKTIFRRKIEAPSRYIICMQQGEHYYASSMPYVHSTREHAEAECKRLAKENGKKYVVVEVLGVAV